MRDQLTAFLATRAARRLRLAVVVLCLLLALLAALSESKPAPARADGGLTVPVAVAVRTLPAGHVLTPGDVRIAQFPKSAAPASALSHPDQVTGHRLAGPVSRSEPITAPRLLGGDLVAGLPAGTVATSLPVDSDTARLVRAGDHVDVIASASADVTRARSAPALVASRVLVLAVYVDSAGQLGGSTSSDVVVATSRSAALRLAELRASRMFSVVLDAP